MKERKSLPESELDIMLVVWKAEGPISAPKIMERLERRLTASALHSYLKRLEEKGFLVCEKAGKTNSWWCGRTIKVRRVRAFCASSMRAPSSALPPPCTTAEPSPGRMWMSSRRTWIP